MIQAIHTVVSENESTTYICIHATAGSREVSSICEYDIYTRSQFTSQINFETDSKTHYKEKLQGLFLKVRDLEDFTIEIGDVTYTGRHEKEEAAWRRKRKSTNEPIDLWHTYEISIRSSDNRWITPEESFFITHREITKDNIHTKIADWFLERLNQDPLQEK